MREENRCLQPDRFTHLSHSVCSTMRMRHCFWVVELHRILHFPVFAKLECMNKAAWSLCVRQHVITAKGFTFWVVSPETPHRDILSFFCHNFPHEFPLFADLQCLGKEVLLFICYGSWVSVAYSSKLEITNMPQALSFSLYFQQKNLEMYFLLQLCFYTLHGCFPAWQPRVNVSHCALEDATHCSQSNFIFGPYIIKWLVPSRWTTASSVCSKILLIAMWTSLLINWFLCGMHQAEQFRGLKLTAMPSGTLCFSSFLTNFSLFILQLPYASQWLKYVGDRCGCFPKEMLF